MVAGDICEPAPGPKAGAELPAAGALPETSNGFVESWIRPVAGGDDDFEEVSDLRASKTDDAAPRANSMTKLHQTPHSAAFCFHAERSANAVPSRGTQ